jgi:hypothetical protein
LRDKRHRADNARAAASRDEEHSNGRYRDHAKAAGAQHELAGQRLCPRTDQLFGHRS